ncbi:unnamed protein product [Thlaspi arvense]|uniref:Uncharacterized protein n=1 Tax=Thlaspi arvense TaxID=13288 RepID=A0AAU9RY53_THLAR|nr:unnamed protein product [Thlaspi arvense]
MGGDNKQSKSRFSSVFKPKRSTSRVVDYSWDGSVKTYNASRSDEDRDHWVADHDIDSKTSIYIAMRLASIKDNDK